jgi:glycosyltransferase involved in cell wall biosynthesis
LKNILLIAYAYPPCNEAGAARPATFAKYLPRFDYRPVILTATGQEWAGGEARVVHVPDRELPLQRRLWRLGTEPGLGWIGPAAEAAGQLLVRDGFAAVISTSPPLSAHVAAYRIKRRHGLKWIADFRDPLCGDTGRRLRPTRFIDPYLESFFFRHADVLIANTDTALEFWTERYPRWRDKMHVIWNGFDPEEEIRATEIPQRRETVLVHAGGLYPNRHPGPLAEAIERLIRRGAGSAAKLKVRLIGSLAHETGIANTFNRLVEGGVMEFLPRAGKEEASRALKEADYLLLLDVKTRTTPLQVPSKVFEYIRIGRPILAVTMRDSPTARILARSGACFEALYWQDPAEENERKLDRFLQRPAGGGQPSEWFVRTFDGARRTEALASILDGLCGGRYEEVERDVARR